MFKNNIDHPSLLELWICLFFHNFLNLWGIPSLWSYVLLYILFSCIAIIYALPLTFFQTNVNLIYVPHVLSHWWFELNNVNWIVGHLTQDRHGNSVTCSVGCTTVTLLLQIHYFPFFRFLVEYTFCQKQSFYENHFYFHV